ncbi:hypothetical protein BD769DRAFT_1686536 [Suillus cothurnatus]|nr:hypothetical protein BD769DRAFT_1686536 [Suillus cothurnatus]
MSVSVQRCGKNARSRVAMLVRLATLSVYLHPEDPDKQATNNAMVNCRGLAAFCLSIRINAISSVDPSSNAYNVPALATATSETRDQDAAPTRDRSRSRSLEPAAPVTVVLRSIGLHFLKANTCSNCIAYGAKKAPNRSQVLRVFGLSIRTQERDLDEEFSRFGRSDRSRGLRMSSTEEATRCIKELNGVVVVETISKRKHEVSFVQSQVIEEVRKWWSSSGKPQADVLVTSLS